MPSYCSLPLLQLREQGKFDLQKPVTDYLPWFSIRTKFAPITGHHLLSHTAGIPRDRDDIVGSPYQAAALRERETGYAPGTRFNYSNIGFQTLGYLLEELTGADYGTAIRTRILEPLGMSSSVSVFTHDTRRRLATGYRPFYDDRPGHRSHGVVEAAWFEYGAGDGSIAATPADLAAYLRMLLNRGAGPNGRILSEESFKLLIQRAIKSGENDYYGYGLSTREVEGRTIVHHGGGMVGYATMLMGDLDEGIGAVVFVNGPGNPGGVAEFALRAMRAALRNQELPALPAVEPPARVRNAADYAGTYTSPDGKKLELVAEKESLMLVHNGKRVALERRGRDQFYVPHPDFALFLLRFEREKPAAPGAAPGAPASPVVEAVHGPDWFAGERYSGPRAFDFPAHWKAYPGHYRAYQPWLSNFRVLLRKGKLWLANAGGGERMLVEIEPGIFQIGEEETAERLRLFEVVGGRALRAQVSGAEFFRFFTP